MTSTCNRNSAILWAVLLATVVVFCVSQIAGSGMASVPDLASYTRGGFLSQKPIVVNPGFEQGSQGWPMLEGYRVQSRVGRQGTAALVYERTDPAQEPLCRQTVEVQPGGKYRFGVWIKTENVRNGDSGGATLCLEYYKKGEWVGGEYPPGISGTNDWTYVEATGTVPAGTDKCTLDLYMRPKATGKAWFDDVTITPDSIRWILYMIRPSMETLPTDNGRLLLGSYLDGVTVPAPDKISEEDLTCLIQARTGGRTQGEVAAPVREGRITVDVGKLPAGPAKLHATLLDTRHHWILSEQDLPVTVAAATRSVPQNACVIDSRGRAIVQGKPFLPVGLYSHDFSTREDLETIANSPFNCLMPYNSLYMGFADSKLTGIPRIREVLDACHERGIKIIFSLKDLYEGTDFATRETLGIRGVPAIIDKAVTTFRDHPALLAWYINDEMPTTMLDQLSARRREVNRLDPYHPTWAVLVSFSELPIYGPTCDVMGVDPYPIRARDSRDMDRVRYSMEMASRAVGTPEGMAVWAVPQIMNWGCYDAKARKDRDYYVRNFRDPTEEEMLSMSLLCAIQGAKGFIYYSYSDLTGYINPHAKPDFQRRWPEVCRVGEVMVSLSPFLLSDRHGPKVSVRNASGKVLAKGFTDNRGRVVVLVAGTGPGESSAVLSVATSSPLRSKFGKCAPQTTGTYRFRGTDICSDILMSD